MFHIVVCQPVYCLSGMGFGSIDTVNAAASDATSTSVTVDTYDSMASNPSIVASQRATAGSLESSSTHGSLTSEGTYTVFQKKHPQHFWTNFETNYQIFNIFGTNIPDTICHQMII